MKTRSGQDISAQVAVFYPVNNLTTENFNPKRPFQIKNDGEDDVYLEVSGVGMAKGDFTRTRFPGGGTWSPEIVREIKMNVALIDAELVWGY